jgi:hypothetical protein
MSDLNPRLVPGQIDFFKSNGYLAIPEIAPPAEIVWLRAVYEKILADERALRQHYEGSGPSGVAGVIDQIFLPERQCPELMDTAYIKNAQRLAADLLGIEASQYGGLMFIFKPAGGGRDVPFHQDEIYWTFPNERCHSLSVWMPLDDVTVDSGCMQFVPGTHALDVLKYKKPGEEPLVLDEPFDVSGAVPCPIPAGGATFHHCRTVHGTAPNTSPRPRRALTTIFHGPRTAREIPLAPPRAVPA